MARSLIPPKKEGNKKISEGGDWRWQGGGCWTKFLKWDVGNMGGSSKSKRCYVLSHNYDNLMGNFFQLFCSSQLLCHLQQNQHIHLP